MRLAGGCVQGVERMALAGISQHRALAGILRDSFVHGGFDAD